MNSNCEASEIVEQESDKFKRWIKESICIRSNTDVTKTGNWERGAGSGERGAEKRSLGTSCQRKPPQKSKMAVQKARERERRRQRKEFVPWLKSGGDEIANQTPILRLRFEQVVCFFDIQPVSFTI